MTGVGITLIAIFITYLHHYHISIFLAWLIIVMNSNIVQKNIILVSDFQETGEQFPQNNYIPRRKSGIYWIQVRRAAAAVVEISLWTR